MSLSIKFSPEALLQSENVIAWAGQHSASARFNLLAVITKKMEGIERMPEMYAVVPNRPDIRRCVVSPAVSLYYRIQPTAVERVAVVDTRRDPDALALPV